MSHLTGKHVEDRLVYIFSNVNEWLRFAEAKNGALLAFSGACIFGLARLLESTLANSVAAKTGIVLALVVLIFASSFAFGPSCHN